MVSIGTLEIAIKADMSDYNRARKTLEQDQGLKFHIVPTVDHKNLVALNRHFSEKEDHHKKVQKGFNQNPLTPKVDLRELNSLTKAYQDLSRLKGNLTSGTGTIHFAVEHTYKVDIRESNRDIASAINGLRNEFKDIGKEFKSSQKTDTPKQQKDSSSNLAKEIKQGFNQMKSGNIFEGIGKIALSPAKAIFTGFYEGIGLTASSKLTKGAIKSIESEWNFTLDALGKGTGKAFGSIGKNAADLLLHSMGTSTEQINGMFEDLSQGFNDIFDEKEARSRIQNIGDTVNKTLTNAFKNGTFISDDIAELKSAINDYKGLRRENIDKRRKQSVDETARQATQQSGMYDAPDLSGKEKAVLYAGGFVGKNSKTHDQNAVMLGKIYGETAQVFQSGNDATNTDASSKDNPVKWMVEATRKITKLNLSGEVNPDVVKMVAQALAIREKNPHITIDLVGHSAGGFIAKDASAILQKLGVENVRGVGIGTPDGVMGSVGQGNYQGVLGKDDTVKKIVDNASILGLTNPSNEASQNMSGIVSHSMIDYLSSPDVQTLLSGQSGISKDELLKGLGDNAEVVTDIKKNIHSLLKEVGEGTVLVAAAVIKESVKQIQNLVPIAGQVGAGAISVGEGSIEGAKKASVIALTDRRKNLATGKSVERAMAMAENEKAVNSEKPIVFAASGIVGLGGKGGKFVKNNIEKAIGKDAATVINFATPHTDFIAREKGDNVNSKLLDNVLKSPVGKIAGSIVNKLRVQFKDQIEKTLPSELAEAVLTMKPQDLFFAKLPINTYIKGTNQDSIKLAAKIIATKKENEDALITLVGHCGGGSMIEEALAIVDAAGYGKNVSGIGIGSPSLGLDLDQKNYSRFVGESDEIAISLGSTLRKHQANIKDQGTLSDLSDHKDLEYLRHSEVIKAMPDSIRKNAVEQNAIYQKQQIASHGLFAIKNPTKFGESSQEYLGVIENDLMFAEKFLGEFKNDLSTELHDEIKSIYDDVRKLISTHPLSQESLMSDPMYQVMIANQTIYQGALKQQEIPLPSVQTIPLIQNIPDINTKTIDITAIEIKQDIIAIETVQEQVAKINKSINEETKRLLSGGTSTKPDLNVNELAKLGASLMIPRETGVGFHGVTDFKNMKREGMIDFISQNIHPESMQEILANRGKPKQPFDKQDIEKYKNILTVDLRQIIGNAKSIEDIQRIQTIALNAVKGIQTTKVLTNVNPREITQLSGYQAQFQKLTDVEGIKFEAKGMGIDTSVIDNAIAGLTNAVGANLPEVNLSGQDIGESLQDGTKKSLKIQSPSKVYDAIGEDVIEGLDNGLTGFEGTLEEKRQLLETYVKSVIELIYDFKKVTGEATTPAENVRKLFQDVGKTGVATPKQLEQAKGYFPQLNIATDRDYGGFYDPSKNSISVGKKGEVSTLIHEYTHALQHNLEPDKGNFNYYSPSFHESLSPSGDKFYSTTEGNKKVKEGASGSTDSYMEKNKDIKDQYILGALEKYSQKIEMEAYANGYAVAESYLKRMLHDPTKTRNPVPFFKADALEASKEFRKQKSIKHAMGNASSVFDAEKDWEDDFTQPVLKENLEKLYTKNKGFKNISKESLKESKLLDFDFVENAISKDAVVKYKKALTLLSSELTKEISKHWDTTAAHISEKMDEIGKKSAEVGYDVQHELAEGSPGLTQRIRDYWDKTVAHIQGRIGQLNNSDTSNLEPNNKIGQNKQVSKVFIDLGEHLGKSLVVGYELGIDGAVKSIKNIDLPIPEIEKQGWENLSKYKDLIGDIGYQQIMSSARTDALNPDEEDISKEVANSYNTKHWRSLRLTNPVNNQLPTIGKSLTDNTSTKGISLIDKLRTQFPIIDQGIEKLRTLKSTIVTLGAAGLGIVGLVLIGKQLSNIAIESVKVYRNF